MRQKIILTHFFCKDTTIFRQQSSGDQMFDQYL